MAHFTQQWYKCNATGVLFRRENLYPKVKDLFELKLSLHLVTEKEITSIFPIITSHNNNCKY